MTARMSAPGRAIKEESGENAHDAVEHKDQLALDRLAQMDRRRDLQKIFPGSGAGHGAVPPTGAGRAAMSLAWAAVLATSPSGTGTPNSRRIALAWCSWTFMGELGYRFPVTMRHNHATGS